MSRTAKLSMVAALLAVVGMGFRVSWNALKDVAGAIGADPVAATVYPLVVDGLMALALVATLVLPSSERRYALRVLAGYTIASLALNYVHGLVPGLHDGGRVKLADWSPANWALVLLATSLPVGSIFFGSDLVAKVLHHTPEQNKALEIAQGTANRSMADLLESSTPAPVEPAAAPLDPTPDPAPEPVPDPVAADPTPGPDLAPAPKPIAVRKPRRSTGAVPPVARAPRRILTDAQVLDQARVLTASWSDVDLKSEPIRRALHISPARARIARDALKAERAATLPDPVTDPAVPSLDKEEAFA